MHHSGASVDVGDRIAAARTIAVIPARYGATRFPGKPLVDLAGKPMVVRVADAARAARCVDLVVVATEDTRIQQVVESSGHHAVMTSPDCASGTDRVANAMRVLAEQLSARDATMRLACDLVVNVQGDEPLIDPADIDVLVEATRASRCPMGTLARPVPSPSAFLSETVVKVVLRADGGALYFSRSPIPHGGDPEALELERRPLQHVGLYAYTPEALFELARLPRSPLEVQESLEQLRALERGMVIHVARCVSQRPTVAIDVPEDVSRVLELLRFGS